MKKAGKTLNLLIKARRRRKFEDFWFKIVRKCFRNALVSADFGSDSVKKFPPAAGSTQKVNGFLAPANLETSDLLYSSSIQKCNPVGKRV